MGSGREVHGKENPRKHYAVGLRTEPAHLVRGSSRRITIMRFRPANIRVINRRNSRLDRDLRCLLRKDGKKKENKEEGKTKKVLDKVIPYQRFTDQLLKLGIDIGESSVTKYMLRCRRPPSQTWRTFLDNHLSQLVSIDFFTVPTIRFQVLYVFLVLAHDRRRILHFNVTPHPTAQWTGQQLRNAFPFEQFPRYLLRDRDAIFGQDFRKQLPDMGIEEVLSTPRSPWQRAYIERGIGSIRRRVSRPGDRLQ